MIPEQRVSSTEVPQAFAFKVNRRTIPLIDYERGGIGVGDASQGLDRVLWKLVYEEPNFIVLPDEAEDTGDGIVVHSEAGVTEVSLSFDQQMRPVLSYVGADGPKIRYFDPAVPDFVILNLDPEVQNPRVSLDELRESQIAVSDVILSYVRNNNLYFRAQRDRFLVEYLLAEGVDGRLVSVGINRGGRYQWRLVSAAI